MMEISSAAGLVSLLDDDACEVKAYALKRLDEIVDIFWAEISDSVNKIEMMHEDSKFQHSRLAALLAAKVYYHLGEFQDSLYYALSADDLFDVNSTSEFVDTIIAKCIDEYIKVQIVKWEANEDGNNAPILNLDSRWDENTFQRLEQVVNRMFERCFLHKEFKQALGIAFETRRLDMFERAIHLCEDKESILQYSFRLCLTLIQSIRFRNKVLQELVKLYLQLGSPDYMNVCQCLIFLDDAQASSDILEKLISQSEDTAVMAYQIAFDLYENATQQYLQRVLTALNRSPNLAPVAPPSEKKPDSSLPGPASPPEPVETPASSKPAELTEEQKVMKERLLNLSSILSGDKVIELHLQFLIRNNKADIKILDRIKSEVRNSLTHNATVLANGFMHMGTTSDQFLRGNLEWLGRAVNWAKFTATSTLGVIHRGHEKEAMKLMSAYLPKESTSGSVYTEGGGLFGLGLIHANHGGEKITEYLLNECSKAVAEPVRHGACLGLGLAAMGTCRQDIYDQIKLNLYQDDAITGEAAGIGMGLVMLGSGSPRAVEDLLSYAKETAHEKIIRGLAIGLALVMFGRMEEADGLVNSLVEDKDPILRWSGMATLAMAYCGSGNNAAMRRLLHAAVSDTNDDVRRWAVTGLGFILFKTPEQVPALVSLLSESYNAHLRYGAAMAIGLACAGTAMKEAMSVLEPLLDDHVHFVRQGALIATSMLLMQQNGVTSPKSVDFRDRALKVISDKHDDIMAKFGAILSLGIMDAGGRNVTISLQTRTGNVNMMAAVGLLVFQNFWYWYPLTNFLSLAFTPTAVIGLNKDLKMPKVEFRSNAKSSTFAYPPPFQVEKEKKKEKVETAILSITAKQKRKEAAKEGTKMDVDVPSKESKETLNKDVKSKDTEDKSAEAEPVVEENHTILTNPARVMRAQQRVLCLNNQGASTRYQTLKPITQGGIIMLRNKQPDQEEEFVEIVKGHGVTASDEDDNLPEPSPPEPFQYFEDNETVSTPGTPSSQA